MLHKDAKVIESLGGPAAVSRLLGYENPDGMRRVSNWRRRGIPNSVKLNNPHLFPHKPEKKKVKK